MAKLSNQQIADRLYEISLMLQIESVPYEPRAYEEASIVIRSLDEELADLYKECGSKCIDDIPSIGESITKSIVEGVTKGKISKYNKLKKKYPFDLPGMVAIEGIGAKKANQFYRKLDIKSVDQLQKAAQKGKIAKEKGFTKKTEKNILDGIQFVKESKGRQVIHSVMPVAKQILDELLEVEGVYEGEVSGSLARMKETIGDIDLIVSAKDSEKVFDTVAKMKRVKKVYERGSNRILVRLQNGLDCDVLAYPKSEFGAVKAYFNSSKSHAIAVRKIAMGKKMKLTDSGLYKGKKKIAGEKEKTIYTKLGLQFIPPELREWPDCIDLAKKKKIPKLIEYGDVKGDLQVQTKWTDGRHSIEDMAKAAKAEGFDYIAITDHTKALAMIHGLNEKRLRKQGEEIKKLNKKLKGFRILRSTECDVLKDGSLDLADDALRELDIVSISLHTNTKMTKAQMTKRAITAMKHPSVNILFHPTGRKVGRRAAYKIDISQIIKAAKEYKVALEVNASDRLDLKDTYIREAVEFGTKLVINTDAHHKDEFALMKYGIGQARRGFAKKSDVINTKSVKELLKWCKK